MTQQLELLKGCQPLKIRMRVSKTSRDALVWSQNTLYIAFFLMHCDMSFGAEDGYI